MYTAYGTTLLNLLREKADPDVNAWWEGYVKHGAPFLGVKKAYRQLLIGAWSGVKRSL